MRLVVFRRSSLWRLGIGLGLCLLFLLLFTAAIPAGIVAVFDGLRREVPIYAVETKEKKIAISFDAAWGADYTDRLLEILKQHGVKTTFFLTGIWVKKYPEKVKEIAAAGHEIGNHSTTHPHCAELSEEELKREILENEELIYRLTGKRTRLFRPPFGEYNDQVILTCRSLGYEVIQWSVDSLDWQEAGVESVVDRVLKNIHPGAIVLFHNNAKYTPQALPIILKSLKEQGYTIVPVSELLLKKDYYIERHTGIQRKKGSQR